VRESSAATVGGADARGVAGYGRCYGACRWPSIRGANGVSDPIGSSSALPAAVAAVAGTTPTGDRRRTRPCCWRAGNSTGLLRFLRLTVDSSPSEGNAPVRNAAARSDREGQKVTNTGHSAAGSAAGYLYQCQAALLELVRRSWDEPDLVVFLEKLDDVEIQGGEVREALQIKHHTSSAGSLSDASVDLWRTIGVWLDVLPLLAPSERASFTLITTGRAPKQSAASMLQVDGRDETTALGQLESAATTSTNQETEKARTGFLALKPNERMRLVQAIEIRDEQPPLLDFYDQLERLLPNVFRREHRDDFLRSVESWWLQQCRRLLTEGGRGVTGRDLSNEIARLRDGYTADNLPVPLDPAHLNEAQLTAYIDEVFVRQLEWIAYSNAQIVAAIHDFHNAEAERSRWLRLGVLGIGDLESYERRLVDTWRRAFLDMVRELEEQTDSETAKQQAGRALLQHLRTQDHVRVRERFSNEMITHGTLHELANCARPHRQQIGWHPAFGERLETLLKVATT
jgi:hypothetical protein